MATRTLHEFLPEVQPEVIDCPIPMILQALRDAAQKLCSNGWVWQEEYTFSLQAGQAIYDLKPEADAIVSDVYDVRKKNSTTSDKYTIIDSLRVPEPDMKMWDTGWRTHESSTGTITKWDFRDERILIVPKPTATFSDWIKVQCVLQPDRSTNTVPEELYDDYAEEIAAGAKGKLMMMPKRSWTNVQVGQEYTKEFKRACRRARWRVAGQHNPVAFHRRLGT